MAIGNAVIKSGVVYIYDEKGHQTATVLTSIPSGCEAKVEYTSSHITLHINGAAMKYDEKGHRLSDF